MYRSVLIPLGISAGASSHCQSTRSSTVSARGDSFASLRPSRVLWPTASSLIPGLGRHEGKTRNRSAPSVRTPASLWGQLPSKPTMTLAMDPPSSAMGARLFGFGVPGAAPNLQIETENSFAL